MPRRSGNVGHRCSAVRNGELCPGLMDVEETRHPRDNRTTSRTRKCPLCGARQTTVERNVGQCRQPVKSIYTGALPGNAAES